MKGPFRVLGKQTGLRATRRFTPWRLIKQYSQQSPLPYRDDLVKSEKFRISFLMQSLEDRQEKASLLRRMRKMAGHAAARICLTAMRAEEAAEGASLLTAFMFKMADRNGRPDGEHGPEFTPKEEARGDQFVDAFVNRKALQQFRKERQRQSSL